MNGTWLERLKRWRCRWFGHWPRTVDEVSSEYPIGLVVCRCCRAVLSTNYSRAKGKS